MISFDYFLKTRLIFAKGALGQLGQWVKDYGGKRVLLVSDPGIAAAGYVARAAEIMRVASLEVFVYDRVGENPTTLHVEEATAAAREHGIDFFVGLGGGSSMDCAKGANFILTNGGEMKDYWGVNKATKPMLPLIAVPTTAGTGSEMQSFALISDATTHTKMACGDRKAAAKVALLDPELTVSLPHGIAAATGMDAISHALESYVSKNRNPISQMFARQAWALLAGNFEKVFEQPGDIEARGAMLLGAALAGVAIENSMLGAAHSCANPLTAHFGVTHGVAIGLMLPHVIRKNARAVEPLYRALWSDIGGNGSHEGAAATGLAERIEKLRVNSGLPTRLGDCGVERGMIPQMSREASQQWTAQFNPKHLTESEFADLYEGAF